MEPLTIRKYHDKLLRKQCQPIEKITEREEYLGEEEVTITSWIMKIISFVIVIYITYSIIKFLNLDLFSIILVLTGIIIGIIVISIVVAFLFGLRNEMKEW